MQLLHYRLGEKLGEGGMGVVWRATDTTLDREVAIKVLPASFAADPERLTRFEREAKLLASLNHPNIATLYGLHVADGQHFLAMELVEGEDLAARLARGPLPVEEALRVGIQVADALSAAHHAGVIHRDLKPANVQLTRDGQVKVLDFGLAKALTGEPASGDLSMSPTMTSAGTLAGMILGTASYMSPEQARGQPVDRRADVWAFGTLMYELLTGSKSFDGGTVTDVIAAVVRSEPDFDALPAETPPIVSDVVRRCLRKDPRQRLQDIAEARIRLEEALADPRPATIEAPELAAPRPGIARWLPWAVAAFLAVALVTMALGTRSSAPTAAGETTRLSVNLKPPLRFTGEGLAISPDGRTVVAAVRDGNGRDALALRRLDGTEMTVIPGSESITKAQAPAFSPDGRWLAFSKEDKLIKLPVEGGKSIPLCDANWGGPAWLPDDTLVFTKSFMSGLWRVSASGGTPEPLTEPDPSRELGHFWPQALPDGRTVIFTNFSTPRAKARIESLDLDSGERKVLIEGGVFGRYVPTGHLLFVQAETLMAATFDAERLEVTGTPVPVLQDVREDLAEGDSDMAVASDGTLAYIPASMLDPARPLVWVDRSGAEQPAVPTRERWREPSISPDGSRVALQIRGENKDIWILDLRRGNVSRLTLEETNELLPVWTPDGKRLIFAVDSPPYDLYWTAADGSEPAELLVKSGDDKNPSSVSPDGKYLLYSTSGDHGGDVWILPLEGERSSRPFLNTRFAERLPVFSPDGRWVAFQSNETGRLEIYVVPFPGPGARYQVSVNGGKSPLWSRDGSEIYYRGDSHVMAVRVSPSREFSAGQPRQLFEDRYEQGAIVSFRNYDLGPDGRFLMIRTPEDAIPREIRIVQNWSVELQRLVR